MLTPLRLNTTDWSFSEKLIWTKGRHSVRVGFDGGYELGSTGYLVYGRGYYTFLNLSTSTLVGTTGGNAFASFLLGAPYEILHDEFPPGTGGVDDAALRVVRAGRLSRFRRRLTVNLGARYDIMPYASEKYNRLSNFDPATGTMLVAGQDTSPRLRNTDYRRHRAARRSGLGAGLGLQDRDARRLRNRLRRSGRRGGDLEQHRIQHSFLLTWPARSNFRSRRRHDTLKQGLPALVMPSITAPSGNQRYLAPTDRNQYSQTWSFSIQRALNPIADAGSRLCRHQRGAAVDHIQHQRGAAGRHQSHHRQPLWRGAGDSGARSPTAATPPITACRPRSSSDFLTDCRSWPPIPGRNRWTTRATARTIPPPPANIPKIRTTWRRSAGLSSFDRTNRFTGSCVVGHSLRRARPSPACCTPSCATSPADGS